MKKTFIVLTGSFLLFALLCLVFLSVMYIRVSRETSERINRGAIARIISSESPVYYDNGKDTIGVFFEKTHNTYLNFEDIPKSFVKAIVASEDKSYFSHAGFDIKAIFRAFVTNLKAGEVVQGGSTITQQTAKNIFKREQRTYLAKLKELMQALLLEKRYSKQEILEMYVNQFFVTGLGKGLATAAEYFFDKDARDLDLVESAFLAGMVKGPNRYNPFTTKSDKEKRKAVDLANSRKNYVLKNMRDLNLITQEQYTEARGRPVPFKEGKITYGLNVILDYVREQLESDYFKGILRKQGIDNIATSGIKIYTSIDKEIQEGALNSIRKELPLLEIELSGYNPGNYPIRYLENMGTIKRTPASDLPFFCTVLRIDRDTENPSIRVSWDGGEGTIPYEGMKEAGEAWLKSSTGRWADFNKSHVPAFLDHLREGDHIPVRFSGGKGEKVRGRLVLSAIPELEGGIVVLRKGLIKAMAGGFFNRYFNRAADARRQLGSIFKPIVYSAALQLKWNNLDTLFNVPDLFKFENTFYIPRPDHEPKSDRVSMIWAGVKSENLATVWLLYHLTDRLNMSEFREVVEKLGLERKENESYNEYAKRIRDGYGVVVNRESLMEAAFESSKKEIESDLIFNDQEEALVHLYRLHYDVDGQRLDPGDQNRARISRRSFERLRSLNFNMKNRFKELQQFTEIYKEFRSHEMVENLRSALRYFYYEKDAGPDQKIIYCEDSAGIRVQSLIRVSPAQITNLLDGISVEEIWIDDLMPSGAIDLLQASMAKRYRELLNHKRYDLEILSKIRDFKVLVNLLYVKQLAREMGIITELDPVMSFPLGANSISILEAAVAYHTMINGRRFTVNGGTSSRIVPIITKIVDREGKIIWEYSPRSSEILTARVTDSVREILRMVIQEGTGRKAKDAVQMSMEFENGQLDVPIPSLGKTGTANRYTNSSFVGFVPGLNGKTGELDLGEGYVIASYVGYDDNRPMKSEHITIYGASGALPLWIETARSIVNSPEYKGDLRAANLDLDMQSRPLVKREDFKPVKVSSSTGLPLPGNGGNLSNSKEIYGNIEYRGSSLILTREFAPLQGVYDD